MATSKFADLLNQRNGVRTQTEMERDRQNVSSAFRQTAQSSPRYDTTALRNTYSPQLGAGVATYAPAKQTRQTYSRGASNNNAPYVARLNSLYDQIVNRKPFRFDLANDPLYRQAAEQYTLAGRQAMADTMGRAAAQTGGYGNSFAQAAGDQQYQQYLTQLNAMTPEIWDRQYQAYMDQGDRLLQQYEMAASHPAYLQALRGSVGTGYTPPAGAGDAVAEQGDSLGSTDAPDTQPNTAEWNAYLRAVEAAMAVQAATQQAMNPMGLHNTWSIADLERRIRESQ